MKKQKIEVKRKEAGIKPKKTFNPKIEYYWFIAIVIFVLVIALVLFSGYFA